MNSARAALLAPLLLLACGCVPLTALAPDGVSAGVILREVRGHSRLDREEAVVPLMRLEIDRALSEQLDVRGWLDVINGRLELDSGIVEQAARGDMQAGGIGLRYHPFSRYLSFDVGAELFHADFAVITKPSLFSTRTSDSAYGWGLSAGLSTAIPITRSLEFTASGGYIVTDNDTHDIHLDFDSFYVVFGLRLGL